MSFDLSGLAEAVAREGRVARVVVAEAQGSAPREAGAAMLVWPGGQSGTIGGGALEFQAAARALAALGGAGDHWERLPLGPALGQCCGGSVTLLTEVWDAARLAAVSGPVVARGPGPEPLAVTRVLRQARGAGLVPVAGVVSGWMVEPVAPARAPVWLWGAGHVGRAIASVLAPLPDVALTWCDTGAARFPDEMPAGVIPRVIAADAPWEAMAAAPACAHHLILTYSHELDLALCHAVLRHGFATAGLIGSATKWARFQRRLAALGHSPAQIARIACPIGDPSLGKHPQAIAVGVAAVLMRDVIGAGTAGSAAVPGSG